jgi:hypothetical protein
MKFELKNEYIGKGTVSVPSLVILPFGPYEILLNTALGKAVQKNRRCTILGIKGPSVIFPIGFPNKPISGDALIVMQNLGYSLKTKNDLKSALNDKERIVEEYQTLIKSSPGIFDPNNLDLSSLDDFDETSSWKEFKKEIKGHKEELKEDLIKASEEFKESTQVSIDDDFDNSTGKKSNSLIPIIIGIVFIIVIYFIWDGSSGSSSISFNEAKIFMKNRCSNIGQTYIDGKSISVDNTRTYVFLTQGNRHPDFYCVTMITENKLEVLKTDCGRSEKKVLFNRL